MPSNISKNLIYILEFQTQHHPPTNLSPITILSKIQRQTIDYKINISAPINKNTTQ